MASGTTARFARFVLLGTRGTAAARFRRARLDARSVLNAALQRDRQSSGGKRVARAAVVSSVVVIAVAVWRSVCASLWRHAVIAAWQQPGHRSFVASAVRVRARLHARLDVPASCRCIDINRKQREWWSHRYVVTVRSNNAWHRCGASLHVSACRRAQSAACKCAAAATSFAVAATRPSHSSTVVCAVRHVHRF